jgi:N utilization substance protein A
MIQKIREAERDTLYEEYEEQIGQLVTGVIQRYEGGTGYVGLPNTEAILPRGEQIPGETHHVNERVRATVYEVKKMGSRVRVILSRTKPQLVQRLFEQEIPEITEGVIEIRAMAREPGYRTKVAVFSSDQRIDCVGACVGVRGNRIKNIVDELAGERIDIVRYNDDMQVLIPNALQPAEVDEVILCQMMGRAIVLVREDQLSLAIGRRGQNVRLASKLCGWDIEIMTREELDEQIEQAVVGFASLDGVNEELAERLVGEGFLSYDDLSVIEPDALMEMGELTGEQVDHIVGQAEEKAEAAERAADEQRRLQREQERLEAARAEAEAAAEAASEGEEKSLEAPAGEAVESGEGGEPTAEPDEAGVEAAAEISETGEVAETAAEPGEPAREATVGQEDAPGGDGHPPAAEGDEAGPVEVVPHDADEPDRPSPSDPPGGD